jgi:hypothetical protein
MVEGKVSLVPHSMIEGSGGFLLDPVRIEDE